MAIRLENAAGLRVELNRNGSLRRMDRGDIIVNAFLGTEVEGGPANIYLRRRGRRIESTPLLGPRSPARVEAGEHGLAIGGEWNGLRFTVSLLLAPGAPAWLWHIEVENVGPRAVLFDLIYAQDLALAQYGAVRNNEYYVSQYIDFSPLQHAQYGTVLAVRQNLPMGGRNPWALLGSLGRCVAFATDALQLHAFATRAAEPLPALAKARLPSKRLQHEHAMAVMQDDAVRLARGESSRRGFFGWLEDDHPAATSAVDVSFADKAISAVRFAVPSTANSGAAPTHPAAPSLFTHRPPLRCLDLADDEIARFFPGERRHTEYRGEQLHSFFTDTATHVVLRTKELQVLRPHGHILRTGNGLVPDEASLTSTVWMNGVFNSMLTQGHVSINRFLSTTRSYLSFFRASGQRVFVELADGYDVLDVPSAFAMSPHECRWVYKHAGGVIAARTAAADDHEITLTLEVIDGPPVRFLVSHHVALNGDDGADLGPVRFARDGRRVVMRLPPDSELGRRFPEGTFSIEANTDTIIEQVGGDELLFADGRSRDQPFVVMVIAPARSVQLRITGQLVAVVPPSRSPPVSGSGNGGRGFSPSPPFPLPETGGTKGGLPLPTLHPPGTTFADDVHRAREWLPWLEHNALIHYLAPRGLEQFSGGGWGTRDVCQGPVELLVAVGRYDVVRDLLLRVFKAQNANGDWPQWFMFFERERNIRPDDSHGDIVFWPLLALAKYILAAEDASLLDEQVPFFHSDGDAAAERATVWRHVERALTVIGARVIPGTTLAAYGHGDWNDSLQPVDPAMRERLCSAWTVTLHHETFATLAEALHRVGRASQAAALEATLPRIRDDFQRLLIPDGTLAGFAHFHDDQRVEYLVHPRDDATGIHYSLLPMIHAIINAMLTPRQAKRHVAFIKKRLLAADGARLFDRPPRYQGGPQRYFQRAESSTYFGREIGLMYMHAHLRYAQAMAFYGDTDAFFLALRQANPIGIQSVVARANLRQSNCYYSSSDAAFADRYEAAARYAEVRRGSVAVDGGWRIYSSGAGIAFRLIHECFLGVRRGVAQLIIDPVMPHALDGLRAELHVADVPLTFVYRVGSNGYGPTALQLNGAELPFERAPNPYRTGGAIVSMVNLRERLSAGANTLTVRLG